ncbi:MAG: alpha/beta hydrolase [Acholeplasmataceae bacterium]|jgi:acetyl esterase/lipase|nr:alpha/beta hydrolase [Acholeplasmataceae bacterium]
MKDYDVDSQLKILKPLRFKRYSNFRRFFSNLVIQFTMIFARPKQGIRMKRYHIKGHNHQRITVYFLEKKTDQGKKPALLYIHGGGFQLGVTPVHLKMVTDMMVKTDYKAVIIKYRLIPKYPFPTALEDSYHALLWMAGHANFLNIDINHLALAGESAGGNLAAGVALLARDRKGPPIEKVLLVYPVLDQSMHTQSMNDYDDTPMWNANLNKDMWKIYMKHGDFGMLPYASPLQADLKGFPQTYIETAEFDCLRDEGVLFGKKLEKAGTTVYTNHTRKTVHGYDALFFSDLVKDCKAKRILFLKGEFYEKDQSIHVES